MLLTIARRLQPAQGRPGCARLHGARLTSRQRANITRADAAGANPGERRHGDVTHAASRGRRRRRARQLGGARYRRTRRRAARSPVHRPDARSADPPVSPRRVLGRGSLPRQPVGAADLVRRRIGAGRAGARGGRARRTGGLRSAGGRRSGTDRAHCHPGVPGFRRRRRSGSPTRARRRSPIRSCTVRRWRAQRRHAAGWCIGMSASRCFTTRQRRWAARTSPLS